MQPVRKTYDVVISEKSHLLVRGSRRYTFKTIEWNSISDRLGRTFSSERLLPENDLITLWYGMRKIEKTFDVLSLLYSNRYSCRIITEWRKLCAINQVKWIVRKLKTRFFGLSATFNLCPYTYQKRKRDYWYTNANTYSAIPGHQVKYKY